MIRIITEGRTDGLIIEQGLRETPWHGGVQVDTAWGKSAALSLARAVLTLRKTSVLLIADADTINPAAAEEQRAQIHDMLHSASLGVPFDVVLVKPTLDWVLFEAKLVEYPNDALPEILQSPKDWLARQHPASESEKRRLSIPDLGYSLDWLQGVLAQPKARRSLAQASTFQCILTALDGIEAKASVA